MCFYEVTQQKKESRLTDKSLNTRYEEISGLGIKSPQTVKRRLDFGQFLFIWTVYGPTQSGSSSNNLGG